MEEMYCIRFSCYDYKQDRSSWHTVFFRDPLKDRNKSDELNIAQLGYLVIMTGLEAMDKYFKEEDIHTKTADVIDIMLNHKPGIIDLPKFQYSEYGFNYIKDKDRFKNIQFNLTYNSEYYNEIFVIEAVEYRTVTAESISTNPDDYIDEDEYIDAMAIREKIIANNDKKLKNTKYSIYLDPFDSNHLDQFKKILSSTKLDISFIDNNIDHAIGVAVSKINDYLTLIGMSYEQLNIRRYSNINSRICAVFGFTIKSNIVIVFKMMKGDEII